MNSRHAMWDIFARWMRTGQLKAEPRQLATATTEDSNPHPGRYNI
jgi:hypothetical protein